MTELTTTSSTANASDDATLFDAVRDRLYTAVVGDVLDQLGHAHQFLPPQIQPITTDMVVVGRAMPVLIGDVFGPQPAPFGRLTDALDQLRPGEVYLARNGESVPTAAWGEILTEVARGRQAAGAVIDGYHRDTDKVLEQNWPVFSKGGYSQDAGIRKSVLDFRVPIEICAIAVTPGDLVFGDRDGVVIVPQAIEHEVIERSLEKASAENHVRTAIRDGMTSTEAFATFGIL